MKTIRTYYGALGLAVMSLWVGLFSAGASADETCLSPYMAKIVGQEDYVYVWTLGQPGVGDEQDKLVTVDANPKSSHFGKVLNSVSVGGRNEAHHGGFTDDRQFIWLGGLDTNKIFVFDVHTDPAKPKLLNTMRDFVAKSHGVVGPHSFYALPGRMLIAGLSNNRDHGGRTGLVEFSNAGKYLATYWMPTKENLQGASDVDHAADGYGYDVRALPRRNALLTSSFTGWSNYMMDMGKMLADKSAMQRFGNTVVAWNLQSRKPKQVLKVPGSPLELRCAWQANHDYCFTASALTSKLWLLHADSEGHWQASDVGDIGTPSQIPLPVDISITADDNKLWVDTFMDGKARLFDIHDPFHPKQIYEKQIGTQLNMVSQSWDGKRLYFTSSLLANWDKKGKDNEQFLRAYTWDEQELKQAFALDFNSERLGRPHIMLFGAKSLYAADSTQSATSLLSTR